MKLTDILQAKAICVNLVSKEKNGVLSELLDLLVHSKGIKAADKSKILTKLKGRESLGSTGIGKGIGIPHTKTPAIKKMVAAFGVSKAGIDFKSLDGNPTYIYFLLVAPGETPGPHLKALAKISRLLDDKFIRDKLRSAKTQVEVMKIFEKEQSKTA
jgi:nitrogen PTS system EIIA component